MSVLALLELPFPQSLRGGREDLCLPGAWEDWVLRVVFSPDASRGSLAVWRNGVARVAPTALATVYNDSVAPYLKFGVYKGGWKELDAQKPTQRWATIAYRSSTCSPEFRTTS